MVQRLEWENITLGQLKMALHLFHLISRFRIVFVCVILKQNSSLENGVLKTHNCPVIRLLEALREALAYSLKV